MPAPTPPPTAPPNRRATLGESAGDFIALSPAECETMITAHASGTPVRLIAKQLSRPVSTVNLWLTRHGLHVHRRHSNHLVRRLALTLVAAGMTQVEVAKHADVTRHSIRNWSRRYPLPALAPGESYDAKTISFYRALLSGATPVTAAASIGRPLSQLDPEGLYSSDVNIAIADQITADTPRWEVRKHAVDKRKKSEGSTGRRRRRKPSPSAALRPVDGPAATPVPVVADIGGAGSVGSVGGVGGVGGVGDSDSGPPVDTQQATPCVRSIEPPAEPVVLARRSARRERKLAGTSGTTNCGADGAGGGALAGMGTYALIGAGTAVADLTAPAWGTAAAVAVVSTGASWAVTEGAKNIWDWFAD